MTGHTGPFGTLLDWVAGLASLPSPNYIERPGSARHPGRIGAASHREEGGPPGRPGRRKLPNAKSSSSRASSSSTWARRFSGPSLFSACS
jgi:hypothetical protein